MSFKVATWNVNSLRVRIQHVLNWLSTVNPDVLVLQETKICDEDFPFDEIKNSGYHVICNGQKTYNGVAILSKTEPQDILKDLPMLDDPQKRVLAATIHNVRIINLYVPNGETILSNKYQYKLNWLEKLKSFVENQLSQFPDTIIMGDFNIAPENVDVHDPQAWQGQVLFSEPERAAFRGLIEVGFKDCFRLHVQPEKVFSWWDYRMNSFKRNRGLRIDHILASSSLASKCNTCSIDKVPRCLERPSDHAPVVAEFSIC